MNTAHRPAVMTFAALLLLHLPLALAEPERQTLDGTWDIIFDAENEGREARWFLSEEFSKQTGRRQIEVPACWDRFERDYEGVAFYRNTFRVPAQWQGMVVRLRFNAVNYLAEVWLNDEVVGFHEGGFTPFEFRVDELLAYGQENTLTLRVVGPIILQDKHVDGVGPLETPQWRGGITGGIWQSVELIATGPAYVEDLFVEPRLEDDSVGIQLRIRHTGVEAQELAVASVVSSKKAPDRIAARKTDTLQLRPGVNHYTTRLTLSNAQYWSPENPHLYVLNVRLTQGSDLADEQNVRFGMREFTIKNKQFVLNGKPLYLRATFFEGLYPIGIAYPDSLEMARREIQLAKEAGFNMIRPWRRPPAPAWLDLADEIGVLVVGSPVLECMRLPLSTPYLPARVEREIRETILRDRNRACVVQWELFNELHRPILKQMMRPMAILTRELDPTRLILDESGGWAYGANIYLPNQYTPTRFNDIHNYPGPFINERRFNSFLTIGMTDQQKKDKGLNVPTPGRNVVPGLMSFVSELGYGSLPNLVDNNRRFERDGNPLTPAYRYHRRLEAEQKQVLVASGFASLYPDFEAFCLDQQAIHGEANKRMIEAVRCNPDVRGYCIHALVAGDWILGAGLLDLWRQPKSHAYDGTKAANQPRILVVRLLPRNVYADRGTTLRIIGVNDLEQLNATLTVDIVAENGDTVFSQSMDTAWPSGVVELLDQKLNTESWRGTYAVKVRATGSKREIISENLYRFNVFAEPDLAPSEAELAVLDPQGSLQRFLKDSSIPFSQFDSATPVSTPVFVSTVVLNSTASRKRYEDLVTFVERGGTAVYLKGSQPGGRVGNRVASSALPFAGTVMPARGLWTCIPHLVKQHPVFAGLPADCMMSDVYENVWATDTLVGCEGEALVASIGFEWFSPDHKLHYSGPGASWWGADLAIVRRGKGRAVVSQLRLVENLGKDPVADAILYNLIRFVSR